MTVGNSTPGVALRVFETFSRGSLLYMQTRRAALVLSPNTVITAVEEAFSWRNLASGNTTLH